MTVAVNNFINVITLTSRLSDVLSDRSHEDSQKLCFQKLHK